MTPKAADSPEAKYALDPPPEHQPKLTHAKLSWSDIMRGDIIDDVDEVVQEPEALPPLPDEIQPGKAPNQGLGSRLLACWTCHPDSGISCFRIGGKQKKMLHSRTPGAPPPMAHQ